MVSSNCGSPDPDKPTEDLSPNNEIIITTDTDTDEEENAYNDYEPLPTHDVPEVDDEGSNSSDNEEGAVANVGTLPPITRMEDTLVKEVWDAPPPKAVDIEMGTDKVDEVKQAMVNFTLPASAIPEWANNIPEDQWKQQLINRLQHLQKK